MGFPLVSRRRPCEIGHRRGRGVHFRHPPSRRAPASVGVPLHRVVSTVATLQERGDRLHSEPSFPIVRGTYVGGSRLSPSEFATGECDAVRTPLDPGSLEPPGILTLSALQVCRAKRCLVSAGRTPAVPWRPRRHIHSVRTFVCKTRTRQRRRPPCWGPRVCREKEIRISNPFALRPIPSFVLRSQSYPPLHACWGSHALCALEGIEHKV
ncbi:hypothetical protein GQ53DRAFT_19542 [Thozetella sp. PMI_491]|nr:hypothetical protein GQ53DRAFT_19542 [Thozetella sp. PMI_491]